MTRRLAFHETRIYLRRDRVREIKLPRLRTFLNFKKGYDFIGTGFLLLRVLELRNALIDSLPNDLKNMIHLRYLDLTDTGVKVVPPWIGDLQNLQTFYISRAIIRVIPESFWKIPRLRHVQSSYPRNSIVGPPSTANLVNLRSLGWFVVPKSWKENLPHLHGVRELKLKCDDDKNNDGKNNDGIVIHNLMSKLHNLLSVSFSNFYPREKRIDFSNSPSYQKIHTMYLSGDERGSGPPRVHNAKMPPNLAKVHLEYFSFNNNAMRNLEKLRGLKCLVMRNIRAEKNTIVCTNGGFPKLQNLTLSWGWVEELKVEKGALPVLKYLHIELLDNFALPGLQCVTTLQELKLDQKLYPKFTDKSGKEWDNIKHIPTITEIIESKFGM